MKVRKESPGQEIRQFPALVKWSLILFKFRYFTPWVEMRDYNSRIESSLQIRILKEDIINHTQNSPKPPVSSAVINSNQFLRLTTNKSFLGVIDFQANRVQSLEPFEPIAFEIRSARINPQIRKGGRITVAELRWPNYSG